MKFFTDVFTFKRNRKAKGQNLVEFALALPVFLVLALFTVEIARVWHTYNAVKQAVNEGVHAAAMKHNMGTGTAHLNQKLAEAGVPGSGTVGMVAGYHAYQGSATAEFRPIFGGANFGIGNTRVELIPDSFPIEYSSIQDSAVY